MNKNKFIVGGLIIAIIILTGGMFLFGRQEKSEPGPASGPTSSTEVIPPTPDQAKEAARTKVTISLTDNGFAPKTMTVKKGTRVIWLNKSSADASVSSDDHPTHQLYPPLSQGPFPPDVSVQFIFEEAGTYGYHNHLKPEQTGTIIVQ